MNPFLVKDIVPGSESSRPTLLGKVNDDLLFTTLEISGGIPNTKLWKTDGTDIGTVLVEDFGNESTPPSDVASTNGNIFFIFNPSFRSIGLYKSDGTPKGSSLIDSYDPRLVPSRILGITGVNDTLFATSFEGTFSSAEPALIKFDGPNFDRVVVKDDFGRFGSGAPANLTGVGSTLYFSAGGDATEEEEGNRELWKSDGTDAGTVKVKDINPGNDASNPENLTDVNGTLFFTTDDGTNGRELWKSDGTEAGTVLVKDIIPGSESSTPEQLTAVEDTLFFTVPNDSNGVELWKSDGTKGGTVQVKDTKDSSIDNLTSVDGILYFTTNDGSNGTELWASDGTEAGTFEIKDINPGSEGSSPDNLTNVNGTLYFTANDGTNGTELWKSDGTAKGTILVGDINQGAQSSDPSDLFNVNGRLYFSADDGVNGREVWAVNTLGLETDDSALSLTNSSELLSPNLNGNDLGGLESSLLNLGNNEILPN